MSTATATEILMVEQKGSVVCLTLNRPEKCNALSAELSAALLQACQAISDDAEVVVLRGSGRHFCAGSDLAELYAADLREAERLIQLEIDACQALASLRQVTIAVTHGKCYGGGAILPLYCDLRIGYEGVEFALPEVPFGWVPPYGLERLKAFLPPPFALEMLLYGRVCRSEEALQKGWIHRLAKNDETQSADLNHLLQLAPAALADTVALMGNKDLEAMRKADRAALQAFLQHLDTGYARSKLAAYMNRKRA